MIINLKRELCNHLYRGFNIRKVVSNMRAMQIGIPISSFIGGLDKGDVFGLELGQHYAPDAAELAIECSLQYLRNAGILPKGKTPVSENKFEVYEISGTVIPTQKDFMLAKDFVAFESIIANQVLATEGSKRFSSLAKGHVLFGCSRKDPILRFNEKMFLTKPLRVIKNVNL